METQKSSSEIYKEGLSYFAKNDLIKGVQCLLKAAKMKDVLAIKELGICYLYAIGVPFDLEKANKFFNASKTNPESQFELSKLLYFGYGTDVDKEKSAKLLTLSVKNNFPAAIQLMAMLYLLDGQNQNASKLLQANVKNDDNFSKHLLKLGLIEQVDVNIDFIEDFNWPVINTTFNSDIKHSEPSIFTIDNLLTEIECEYLKFVASPFMRPSMTVDPITGTLVRDTIRTSYSSSIDWHAESPAVNLIMSKCCTAFNEESDQSEVLHVLHYSPGEEYKPHYDFIGGEDNHQNFDESKQRIKTICLYLNDEMKGGETTFPKLDISVSPKKGSAIFFENVDTKTMKPYLDSLHSGKPILEGEKWLATLWVQNSNTNRGPNYASS